MKLTRLEYHQLTSYMRYDIPDEDIIAEFESIENFIESEDEDNFHEFMMNYDYDREDDLWTDRKGGYDVEYQFGD